MRFSLTALMIKNKMILLFRSSSDSIINYMSLWSQGMNLFNLESFFDPQPLLDYELAVEDANQAII